MRMGVCVGVCMQPGGSSSRSMLIGRRTVERNQMMRRSGILHGGSGAHTILRQLGPIAQTRFPIAHEDGHSDATGGGQCRRMMRMHGIAVQQAGMLVTLLVLCTLGLVAMILEPDLHLCGRQTYQTGQMLTLGCAQVALLSESTLQLVRLRLGEEHATLALLIGHAVGIDAAAAAIHIVHVVDVLLDAILVQAVVVGAAAAVACIVFQAVVVVVIVVSIVVVIVVQRMRR